MKDLFKLIAVLLGVLLFIAFFRVILFAIGVLVIGAVIMGSIEIIKIVNSSVSSIKSSLKDNVG